MLYQILSGICRMGAIVLVALPFVTIDAAPDHFIAYLFSSVLAVFGGYCLFNLADRIDKLNQEKKETTINILPATPVSEHTHAA